MFCFHSPILGTALSLKKRSPVLMFLAATCIWDGVDLVAVPGPMSDALFQFPGSNFRSRSHFTITTPAFSKLLCLSVIFVHQNLKDLKISLHCKGWNCYGIFKIFDTIA